MGLCWFIVACHDGPIDRGDSGLDGARGPDAAESGLPGPICDGADLFSNACTGVSCHFAGEGNAQGLDLQSPGVPDRLVGVPSSCGGLLYIDPESPAQSFLLEKITQDAPACGGSRMPFNGQLTDAQIECVRTWILETAGSN